MAINER